MALEGELVSRCTEADGHGGSDGDGTEMAMKTGVEATAAGICWACTEPRPAAGPRRAPCGA